MPVSEDRFSNKEVAKHLRHIAASFLLATDLQESPKASSNTRFRMIAYQKVADTVEHLSRELKDLWAEGKLYSVPGIGPGIGSALSEYFEKGESTHFNELLKGIPPSVFTLMEVPGIGPKKAFRLVATFGLTERETVIHDLLQVARAGRIAGLEGFGQKSQDDIISSLEVYLHHDRRDERMPLSFALSLADEVTQFLSQLKEVEHVDVLGSLRRMSETIGDIDIAVMAKDEDATKIVNHFLTYPGKRSVEAAGDHKASILAAGNVRIDLRVQDMESYGSMLQYFTGSKAHNIKLREHALKKGYSLSEYGLKRMGDSGSQVKPGLTKSSHSEQSEESISSLDPSASPQDDIIHFKDEKSLYEFLGLPYIPPEMREGQGEIELAKKRALPTLIDLTDIKGDLHTHSSFDIKTSHDVGLNTFAELSQKSQELGYSYIGFTDHNPKQSGISSEEVISLLKSRKEHIDQVLLSTKITYYIGLEVDILPSGEIAFPKEALPYVDYLIVSIHSAFRMERKQMTERILKALSFPKVKILGHPTGRLIGKRDGVDADWDAIFAYAIENRIALEINSGSSRLDLPSSLVQDASRQGALFTINTDAHAVPHMDWMRYGVSVARRGWLTPEQVVNTWENDKMREWIVG